MTPELAPPTDGILPLRTAANRTPDGKTGGPSDFSITWPFLVQFVIKKPDDRVSAKPYLYHPGRYAIHGNNLVRCLKYSAVNNLLELPFRGTDRETS
jgi:hypothetical protein